MNKKIKYQLPDYDNCCVNLISSVAKHFKIKTNHKTLPLADKLLKKNYKNIVVLLLDGLGKELFNRKCDKNNFFAQCYAQDLSAVFPSSTTPSTVSFKSGYTPLEHGWWAHFLYFKEIGGAVNLYLNTDAYSRDPTRLNHIAHDIMPYETIHERIYQKHKDSVRCYAICPTNCRDIDGISQVTYDSFDEMANYVKTVCANDGKHYIYAYYDYPDKAEHRYGVYSNEVAQKLAEIEAITEMMCKSCKDTLFLISADHGQTEVHEVRDLAQYRDLCDCFSLAPNGGTRTMNCFVKADKKAEFKKLANKYFGDKFLILSKKEVLEKNLLGDGVMHYKTDDTLGDFLIISVSDCSLFYSTLYVPKKTLPLGGHGGLSHEEMTVPLFVFENKNKTA